MQGKNIFLKSFLDTENFSIKLKGSILVFEILKHNELRKGKIKRFYLILYVQG